MSTVDLILTDSRLWARSESTHWDGAPSVVPASDGTSLVVGEPLQPPSPAVSVVRLAAADRIAFVPMLPTVADAFAAIFGAVLTNLRLPSACERLTVVSPSEWGTRRRAALEAGARRLAGEISVEPLALRVAGLSASTSQQQRIAVVELNSLTTTVTLTGRSGTETWIEACEYEPTIGSADLAEGRGVEAVVDVVDRLLGGRKPSYLVVVGAAEPALLDAIRAELSRRYGFGVDLRAMSGVDLVRGGPAMPAAAEPAQLAPQTPWVGSLHEHAAATAPPPKRRTPLLIGAAVVAVVVAAAAAAVLTRSGGNSPTDRSTAARPSAVASPSAEPAQPAETFGRVGAVIPAGWHITNRSGPRVDISPNNGARERISLVQKDLAPGSGVEDVAATLETQIAKRPAGTVGPLQRNVIFGGRPGLSYEETPGDGTTVRWQVLVDSGLQVSVGCQYPTGDWQPIAAVCEKFVGDLRPGA
ncbi:type VII secretion-associated protein (TIGR03931 family) [Nocardia kruczakiae]|uniref:Type VII secretion-associated protein (TIGR03931 family) n=1 Tax=Nocardia kruczakiae TaxID=261477 RepID=A0ABU1XKV5_9NOCA|nr:type VII secretion-associated protein [Nocardia kruczakiae]MDR7171129.1 type VII secretion-associated protein (TIGR03931 family) [Nocardia kruczakiae]